MEYRITQLKAEIATGVVVEANWGVSHVDGAFSAYRYGTVHITPEPTPLLYAGLDEGMVIERVKDVLGEETVAAMEQSMIDEVEAMKNPTTISGLPWAVPPAPAPAPAP